MTNPGKLITFLLSSLFVFFSGSIFAAGGGAAEINRVSPDEHFHPKGKAPSEHTVAIIKKARESMPFEDTRDFDEAKKGLIAPLASKIVMADAGNVAWDLERYDFISANAE